MSTLKTIGLVLGTMVGLLLLVAGGVAFLIYAPAGTETEEGDVFTCPEEQYTVMCVLRGYLVPSVQRH